MSTWKLPGPSRFVDRIVGELRQTKSVVLLLPSRLPRGLVQVIRQRAIKSSWRWLSHTPVDGQHPLDQLCDYFIDGSSDTTRIDHDYLARHEELSGTVINIHLGQTKDVAGWIRFIMRYAEAVRHSELSTPLSFVVVLPGKQVHYDEGDLSLEASVHLSVRRWQDVIRPLDARHVAEIELRARSLDPLEHQLAVEIIARVALWDLKLATEMARYSLPEIYEPYDNLEKYARSEGWTVESKATWTDGTFGRMFGEKQTHSALCVIHGNLSIVKRRVWAAQAGVIFPFLEARLKDLLQHLDCLPPSITVRNGRNDKIVSQSEFEFSHIDQALDELGQGRDELAKMVKRLKKIRNRIAHFEQLRISDLQHLSLPVFNGTVHGG